MAVSATAWMLSGLTPSPLLNGLLPVLTAGASLLPLRPRARLGFSLQSLALFALLALAFRSWGPGALLPVVLTLLAMLLWAIGRQLSQESLNHHLLSTLAVPLPVLRGSGEMGRMLGNLMMGLLFPVGRSLGQFAAALVLSLPLLPLLGRQRRGLAIATTALGRSPSPSTGLHRGVLLQGMLFGGLFALLPLWVRLQAQGDCLDFGFVLGAYGAGRLVAQAVVAPRWFGLTGRPLVSGIQYAAMAVLLLVSQRMPGLLAVGLFLPFGLLAALRDQALLLSCRGADGQIDLACFERSGVLGGLCGALAMGLLIQSVGLAWGLPVQLCAFVLAALLLRARPSAVASV